MYKVSFNTTDREFFESVKRSAEAYFVKKNISVTGNRELYVKSILFISLAVSLYVFLLLGTYGVLGGVTLTMLFVFSLIAIAFNVMHDACHGSYSSRRGVNSVMSFSMNALGGNAFLWKITHNVIHHTYTNIDGIDHDIANWPLLRQCTSQSWKPLHRHQHIYMFLLYALHTVAWMLVFDFSKYFSRKVATTPIKHIGLADHFLFWISKVLYICFYVLLPVYFVGWEAWGIGFSIVQVTMGLVITTVFQLAHLVELTSFGHAGGEPVLMESSWAAHEVMTTANFAQKNRVVTWLLGGLNFQIEHHLFPHVSHVHYAELSYIVREECKRFNLPYHSYSTVGEAFASHINFMKKLGKNIL